MTILIPEYARLQRIENRLKYDIWLMETALPDLTDPEAILMFKRVLPQLHGILKGQNPSYPNDPKYKEVGRDLEDIIKERGLDKIDFKKLTAEMNENIKNGSNIIDELKKWDAIIDKL